MKLEPMPNTEKRKLIKNAIAITRAMSLRIQRFRDALPHAPIPG